MKRERGRKPKKKICSFCVDKVETIDYKELNKIRRYTTERGKILPRRISGNCAKHQRRVTLAIKRARIVALLPQNTGLLTPDNDGSSLTLIVLPLSFVLFVNNSEDDKCTARSL